jgi:hypothetical protein
MLEYVDSQMHLFSMDEVQEIRHVYLLSPVFISRPINNALIIASIIIIIVK